LGVKNKEIEVENGSHRRIKVKNPQYVAIAHLRGNNGNISPKNVGPDQPEPVSPDKIWKEPTD
jgi:hypothetical protein